MASGNMHSNCLKTSWSGPFVYGYEWYESFRSLSYPLMPSLGAVEHGDGCSRRASVLVAVAVGVQHCSLHYWCRP